MTDEQISMISRWVALRLSGKSNKEIASTEGYSPRTTEALFIRLREHYGAKDFIHLVGILINKGLYIKSDCEDENIIAEELSAKYTLLDAREELNKAIRTINIELQRIINMPQP